jgi:uncharacterized protein YecT (DUF1311 family)
MIDHRSNTVMNQEMKKHHASAARPLPRSIGHPLPRFHSWIAVALMALAPALATANEIADQHPIEAELLRCMETPEGMSTQGMRHCIDQANSAWDKELNRIWTELMAELAPAAKQQLRLSQRQWLAFRDAEYEALDSAYGAMSGSMFQPMHAEAIANVTRDRARQLDSLLEAQRVNAQ